VYVGMGQIIDPRENERVGIAWTLAEAKSHDNEEAVRELEALRPYPDAGPFTIDKADGWRKWAIQYGSLAAYRPDANFYLRAPRLSPDYSPADLEAWDLGSAWSVSHVWPLLGDISFKKLDRLSVPVVMFIGRHDMTTPASIAAAWMDRLHAPKKATVWFEHSSHLPMVEEPGRTFAALLEQVRPLATR
jgi:proline iminopeptidase